MKLKKEMKKIEFVVCPYCSYNNSKENVRKFGTCLRCKKTIDEKAKFMYEMYFNKLHLWRYDKNKRKWD